jgi:hypothetical protein
MASQTERLYTSQPKQWDLRVQLLKHEYLEGVDLTHLSQDSDQWQPVMNTIMNEEYCLPGYYTVQSCRLLPGRIGRRYCLLFQVRRVTRASTQEKGIDFSACFSYSSALKMQTVRSSETSANFYQTTQCNIPQDRALHSYLREIRSCHMVLNIVFHNRTVLWVTEQLVASQ